MFKKHFEFKIFNKFKELDCRFYGKNQEEFIGNNEYRSKLIKMEQVHGNDVVFIDGCFNDGVVKEADGIVTKTKNIFLGVKTADCVPVFLYEPNAKIMGLVHSGWKGTLLEVVKKALQTMKNNGADINNVRVGIGPYIHDCCYKVDKERFQKFVDKFKEIKFIKNNYLDLGYIVRRGMIESGVQEKNVEMSDRCTKCSFFNKFYSFRRGDKFANNIGLIGLK